MDSDLLENFRNLSPEQLKEAMVMAREEIRGNKELASQGVTLNRKQRRMIERKMGKKQKSEDKKKRG